MANSWFEDLVGGNNLVDGSIQRKKRCSSIVQYVLLSTEAIKYYSYFFTILLHSPSSS